MTKQEFIKNLLSRRVEVQIGESVLEAFERQLNGLIQPKPLEWGENENGAFVAQTPFGKYWIYFSKPTMVLKYGFDILFGSSTIGYFNTLFDAQVAAEKDYQERFNQMIQ